MADDLEGAYADVRRALQKLDRSLLPSSETREAYSGLYDAEDALGKALRCRSVVTFTATPLGKAGGELKEGQGARRLQPNHRSEAGAGG